MQQYGRDYEYNVDYQMNGSHRKTHVDTCVIEYQTDPDDSTAVDLRGYGLLGLILPTLDSCNITFYVSDTEGGTYYVVSDATGAAITITATTGDFAVASNALAPLEGYRWVTIHTSAEQTADRTFTWILKG